MPELIDRLYRRWNADARSAAEGRARPRCLTPALASPLTSSRNRFVCASSSSLTNSPAASSPGSHVVGFGVSSSFPQGSGYRRCWQRPSQSRLQVVRRERLWTTRIDSSARIQAVQRPSACVDLPEYAQFPQSSPGRGRRVSGASSDLGCEPGRAVRHRHALHRASDDGEAFRRSATRRPERCQLGYRLGPRATFCVRERLAPGAPQALEAQRRCHSRRSSSQLRRALTGLQRTVPPSGMRATKSLL